MTVKVPDETVTAIADWCRYHYRDSLLGLALFDPTPVNAEYPHGEINVLVVLDWAPAEARDRYDAVGDELLKGLAPNHSLTCRIQTVDEIGALAEMKLPLLAIYLTKAEILHDPRGFLRAAQVTLRPGESFEEAS